MTPKSEQLVNLIFKKLKNYKAKEIFLEKENFNKFIFSLFKENAFGSNRGINITEARGCKIFDE